MIISILCCFSLSVNAQDQFPFQTLRGEIRDADAGDFLQGATVEIQINENLIGAVADENGVFIEPKCMTPIVPPPDTWAWCRRTNTGK